MRALKIVNLRRKTMATYMAKKEELNRKWYVIDAAGKTAGRVAATAASILNGKHKPEYTPHVDCGDFVIIVNAAKVVWTGKKLDQKKYYRHTGYVGGLKEQSLRDVMEKKPEFAMKQAVKGMLPHNTIGAASIGRLKVYAGAEHEQQAQKPEAYEA